MGLKTQIASRANPKFIAFTVKNTQQYICDQGIISIGV